jgi:Zn-dependent M28 family amino/carboxypeptidase
MKTLLSVILLSTAVPATAITVEQLKTDTKVLASDEFEGREPGSPGETKTIDYLVKRMTEIGLKPGNNGQWTQDVPMVSITTAPTPLQIAGGKAPMTLAYGPDQVVWTKRQVAQQALVNSPIVFIGYGINAPDRGWNDYEGMDVRGKTVVMLVNDADWWAPASGKDAGPFNGKEQTYYGRYILKFEEAVRQGAAGAIIIHQEVPAAWPYSVVISSWTGPQIDLDSADKGMGRLAVEGWLNFDAATRLFASAGLDLRQLEKAAGQRGFRAVETGLKASTKLENTIVRSNSKNVVGIIPGSKRPDEVVLVTAHWDHIGHCTPDATGDDICNGALDNATGTAGLMGIADDVLKGPRPDRSMVFLAVTGEESGLLGSEYYAKNPVYPLGKTVGGVNMDVLNVFGKMDGLTIIGAGQSELEAIATRLANAQGRKILAEAGPEKGHYFRSDHFSLARRGVPMLFARGGGEVAGKPPGFGRAAEDFYVTKQYHTPSDEYSPDLDWSGAVDDLLLYRDVGLELANSDKWPNWLPSSEFRAIRDASRKTAP